MAEGTTSFCPPSSLSVCRLVAAARIALWLPCRARWLPALPGTSSPPASACTRCRQSPHPSPGVLSTCLAPHAKEPSLTLLPEATLPSVAQTPSLARHGSGFALVLMMDLSPAAGLTAPNTPLCQGQAARSQPAPLPAPLPFPRKLAASRAVPGPVGVWQTAFSTVPVPSSSSKTLFGAGLDPEGACGFRGRGYWSNSPGFGGQKPFAGAARGRTKAILCGGRRLPCSQRGLSKPLAAHCLSLLKAWALSIRHHVKHIVVS